MGTKISKKRKKLTIDTTPWEHNTSSEEKTLREKKRGNDKLDSIDSAREKQFLMQIQNLFDCVA